jgi:hypothetical protein
MSSADCISAVRAVARWILALLYLIACAALAVLAACWCLLVIALGRAPAGGVTPST